MHRLLGFRPFARNERGSVAVYTAILLPVLLATAGLATDVGYWHLTKKRLQNATDLAAIGGTAELALGNDNATVTAAAKRDSGKNGFADGTNATVAVSVDRTANTVTVSSTTTAPRFFSALVSNGAVNVDALAVGQANTPPVCMLALNTTNKTISLSGGSKITGVKCIVYSDSTGIGTVNVSGGSTITAGAIKVVGTTSGSGGSTYTPTPETGVAAYADPYASVTPPTVGVCDHATKVTVSGGTHPFSPGVYCGGITISSATGTFSPGTYILKNGPLTLSGGSKASGTGVAFYLVGTGALVNSSGGSTTSFTAPTSGALKGFIFFQDRAITGVKNVISGGGATVLSGILYFPKNEVDLTGGSTGSVTKLSTAVAGLFLLSGSSNWTFDPNAGGGAATKVSIIQ